MPPKKGKKKAQAGNSRGFATTSVPSKPKEVVQDIPQPAIDTTIVPVPAAVVDLEHERLVDEDAQIVESGSKQFSRLNAEIEIDRRARKQYTQLSMPEDIVERIIALHNDSNIPVRRAKLTDLISLYSAELLLKSINLDQVTSDQVLRDVKNLCDADDLLYHVSPVEVALTIACEAY